MKKVSNSMDNQSYEQFIIMQATIESNKQEIKINKQDSDEKMTKFIEDFKAILGSITDQIKTLKSSPNQKGWPKSLDPTTVLPANKRAPPLEGSQFKKIGGMWSLKHEISSPKILLIPHQYRNQRIHWYEPR